MLVSVITVVRNNASTIKQTIESVVKQKGVGEYIIVDGMSTDGTRDIIEKYVKQYSNLIKYVSQSPEGVYKAMNHGISLARYEIIGIINADDFYEEDCVSRIIKCFKSNCEIDICYGFLRQMFKDTELIVHRANYDLILADINAGIQSSAQHPTCFVRKALYNDIGKFDETYTICADYEFLLRAKRLGANFFGLNEIIANFRLGGISSNWEIVRIERERAQRSNGFVLKHKQTGIERILYKLKKALFNA